MTQRPEPRWRAGMLLERLDGRSPAKVVGAKNFHDVGYLRDLLFTVFTALDVGQRRMGALRPGAAAGARVPGSGQRSPAPPARRPVLSVGRGARGPLRQCQAPCWLLIITMCCYAWGRVGGGAGCLVLCGP